jgi:hypothetical protein
MVPVPGHLMSRGILVNHVRWVHHGIIQVLRLEDRVLIPRVFFIARAVPSPRAYR